MVNLTVGNGHIALGLAIGGDKDRLTERGILVASIRDVSAGRKHEYLAAPTFLFEFAVDDGPPRLFSRDLRVTGCDVIVPSAISGYGPNS